MSGGAHASLLGTILRWAVRAGWPPWAFALAVLGLLPRTPVPIDAALRWVGDLFHLPVVWAATLAVDDAPDASAVGLERLRERAEALRAVERRRVLPTGNLLRGRAAVFADVLLRDGESWWLGAGRRHGVRVGDFATHRDQIVGQVTAVEEERSRLATLASEEVRVPVVVGESPLRDGEEELVAVVHGRSEPLPWPIAVTHPSRELPEDAAPVRVSLGPPAYRALRAAAEPEALAQLARVDGFHVGTLRSRMLLRRTHYVEPERAFDLVSCVQVHAAGPTDGTADAGGSGVAFRVHRTIDPRDSEPGRASVGLAAGRRDGLRRGAPVVSAGRLFGEVATDAPWTVRVAPVERRGEPFAALLLLGDADVLACPALVVEEREGDVLWLGGVPDLREGTRGELYTAPRAVPGWKGLHLGSCVVAVDGRLALAHPSVEPRWVAVAEER